MQKLDRNSPRAPRPPSENMMDIPEVPTIRYEPTLRDAARYQTITMMPVSNHGDYIYIFVYKVSENKVYI